jgi:hypothetical protein
VPRRLWRQVVWTGATLAVAAVTFVGVTLPPRAVRLDGPAPAALAFGAYHVHTTRSDGDSSPEEVAAAAARAGLQFVIFTDHGDATRPPDPPVYRHGVLCVDAVEISSAHGHVVALGLTQPAPYPFGGEARDVVDDIHRLGGWAIVAHPDSLKPDLRWRSWGVPYDAVEWLNADSEWRDESSRRLAATFGRYLMRGPETLASLFDRPRQTLQRWDAATRGRPVVALAGLDAHGGIAATDHQHAPGRYTFVRWPAYEDLFRTLVQAVALDRPLAGQADADAASLLDALRRGRTYSVVTALAHPGVLDVRASDGVTEVPMGGSLPAGPRLTIRATTNAPGSRVVLVRDGTVLAAGTGRLEFAGESAPGAYRVEVSLPPATVPWIVANPVYVVSAAAAPDASRPAERPADVARLRELSLREASGWVIEREPASQGAVAAEAGALRFTYALGPGARAGQYAALVHALDGTASFDRVAFTARADRPMRVSVQVRLPGGRDGQRWQRTVYVDTTARPFVLPLQDFEPIGVVTTQRPIVARVHAVLLVVDTTHAAPGATGTVWFSDVRLAAPDGPPGGG